MSDRFLYRTAQYTFLAMIGLFSVFTSGECQAQINDPGSFTINSFTDKQFELYERQLNALLKTRRDEEKEFVKKVVALVKDGKVTPKLVQTSYGWVRNNRPFTKYPFVFFERVLRKQAEKAKVGDVIPKFDYGIYSRIVTSPTPPTPNK